MKSLERIINENAFIDSAEISLRLDGQIGVEIVEKEPVFRVLNGNYYVDLNGNKITTKGALILVEAALNKGTHNYPSTLYLNENHIGKDFATGLVKLFRNTKKRNVKIFFRKQQSSDAKQLIKKMDAKLDY